ncbi:site-specific DNA recombinase [Thermoactinomyces sp. DSM 45891]|uniref:recombinase family protein n=1 Tax=Thermoactinomyces sp. DSM 45891 TaxID=1761907 RepID=UPI00090F441D|nr:recombinase family protein [Thermoactinomyces sp. DSM 45891]SFX35592.1 site-specific DNA recombinase [Thermoactinomyces sp. DSM 45891]
MATAIYVRVSTDEQAKKGFSIPAQLEDCRAKAREERVDNEIIEYIDDGITGSILERPSLEKLRNDIRQGIIDTVIVLDPDRLARGTSILLILTEEIEKYCKLMFVNSDYNKTPEGMLFYQLKGIVSEFERAKTRERSMRGIKQKMKLGKIVRGNNLYGYNFNKETDMFDINDEEAEIVRLIFNKFVHPDPCISGPNMIARWLNEQSIPTKKRVGKWHRSVVRRILCNSAYKGEFIQNKTDWNGIVRGRDRITPKQKDPSEWVVVNIPAIIDPAIFEIAQDKIQVSRRLYAGLNKHKYLLSGLCRCSECDRPMRGKKVSRKNKVDYYYYCKCDVEGSQWGCGKSIRCSDIDDIVWNQISQLLSDPDCIEDTNILEDNILDTGYEREIKRLERELSKIEQMKSRLFELLSTPELVEDVRKKLIDVTEKRTKLLSELECLKKEQSDFDSYQLRKDRLKEVLKVATEYYYGKQMGLGIDEKQHLVRLIVKEVRISSYTDVEIITY